MGLMCVVFRLTSCVRVGLEVGGRLLYCNIGCGRWYASNYIQFGLV
jgi:hypothetical protein